MQGRKQLVMDAMSTALEVRSIRVRALGAYLSYDLAENYIEVEVRFVDITSMEGMYFKAQTSLPSFILASPFRSSSFQLFT